MSVRARLPLMALLGALVIAPAAQSRQPLRVPALDWHQAGPGIERATIEVAGGGEGWRTRIVAVTIDPVRFRFRLRARLDGIEPAWSVDRAPRAATFAVNAGQFNGITPWGWVVMGGQEIRPPGQGPLSTAIAWDAEGRIRWLGPGEIARARAAGWVVEAFQSYPTLIDAGGNVPPPIREPGLGVDVEHRDSRLAIGSLADGRLVVAITRFYGLGPLSPSVPLGLNLSEMATVMQGLGAVRAVSLDGGVSAQLMLREYGAPHLWRGWRRVPLGLVAEPKPGG